MYVASMLRARGHDTDMFVAAFEGSGFARRILEAGPDIIAFSCLAIDYHWALGLAAELHPASDALIVFGGTHVTLNAEDCIARTPVDVVCVGEGEHPMAELADAISAGAGLAGIPNLWVKCDETQVRNPIRDLVQDLDALPFPDRHLYSRYPQLQKRGVRPMHLSRGCPYDCTYCHNSAKKEAYRGKGRYVRWRGMDSVLEEIDQIEREQFVRLLHVIDDGFGMNSDWTCELIGRLAARPNRLAIHANMRADMVTDDLCRAMREYGADRWRLRIAVECGDERYRREVLCKNLTDEALLRAADLFHRHGLPFVTYNMVGLPGECLDQGLETLRLNMRLRPEIALCFVFQPYPGTRLASKAVEEGHLRPDDLERLGRDDFGGTFHSPSPLRHRDTHRLQNLQRMFALVAAHPWLYPLASRLARLRVAGPLLSVLVKVHTRYLLMLRRRRDGY